MVFDNDKIIEETIDIVVKKYSDEEQTIVNPYREIEEGELNSLENEIFEELDKLNIPFNVIKTEAFESCGYECSTIIVSWYNKYENKVKSTSILTEIC